MAGLPQDSTPNPWATVAELVEQLQVQTKLAASQAEQLQELQEKLAAAQALAQATSQAQGVSGNPRILELEKTPTSGGTRNKDSWEEEIENNNSADFLFTHSKFHDCYLTVGNPAIDNVERIGVSSVYLIANSPVFRKMLDCRLDSPEAVNCVSDVSPAIFRLLLRYLYGGKLPKMSAIETAGLTLCADKYRIPRLVVETVDQLMPTSADDVFPALICVTFASFPDLKFEVCKIIQQQTDKVVENGVFLKLDEACLIFILKQNTLNINEVELWKHVVCWAKHQVEINSTKTVREYLSNILQHVRFLTFTLEEVVEHVLPTEALSSDEFVDLIRAVTKKQPLQSKLLCSIEEKRNIGQGKEIGQLVEEKTESEKEIDDSSSLNEKAENNCKSIVFDKLCSFKAADHFEVINNVLRSKKSSLIITPHKPIQIESFICWKGKTKSMFCCSFCTKSNCVRVEVEEIGVNQQFQCFQFEHSNNEVAIPVKFISGQPIVMNPNKKYNFTFRWIYEHPVYDLQSFDETRGAICVTKRDLKSEDMTVTYSDSFHVVEIVYKKQEQCLELSSGRVRMFIPRVISPKL